MPAVDPIKILKKYVWLLVAAGVVGAVVGFVGNALLARYAPVWRADVVFRAAGPASDPGQITEQVNEDELERFMETQVQTVTSPRVLDDVISDPRLTDLAPSWIGRFRTPSGGVDVAEARADLLDRSVTRVAENTELFRLTVNYRNPDEARELAALITQKYLNLRERSQTVQNAQQTDAVRTQISNLESRITVLEADKARLISDGDVDTVNEAASETAQALRQLSLSVNEARNERALISEQIAIREASIESGEALQFSDSLRARVDVQPVVQGLKNRLQELRTFETELELRGFNADHRSRKAIRRQIEASETELGQLREAELQKLFFAEIDALRQERQQFDAQIADLNDRINGLRERQIDLTRTLEEIRSIDRQLDNLGTRLLARQEALSTIEAAARPRVTVSEPARARDTRSSPKLVTSLAAAIFIIGGGTAGLVILREVLDQRIKGPSDVALIPRARVLGMLPLATEDPANPKHFETIVRDQPRGVLAECFRQLTTVTLKRMLHTGAKSLVVVPASPGSGATSVITNIAHAAAAVEQRVLIIDANFRRAGVHKALGLEEGPGLADLLARVATIEEAVVEVAENIHVMPAGSRQHRIFERLAGRQMSDLIATASGLYDLVLVDVAPAVVSGDAIALANQCDASVLVVRALSEKRGMIARLRSDLSDVRAEMLGVLVNAVRASAGGYMRRNIRTAHAYQGDVDPTGQGGTKERDAA